MDTKTLFKIEVFENFPENEVLFVYWDRTKFEIDGEAITQIRRGKIVGRITNLKAGLPKTEESDA